MPLHPPLRSPGPPSLERGLWALGLLACFAWRLLQARRFAGWEESDYGNLAMIQGVLDGGFAHYDMNHMPGYYALGAAVLAVVGDAVLAGKVVSMTGGLAAWALAVSLSRRFFGGPVAVITGFLLIFQPEFALYTSSQLREPVYVAYLLACLTALINEKLGWAGIFAALAFTVRFDAMFVLPPLLLLGGRAAGPGLGWLRWAKLLLPLPAAILAWSAYCGMEHGTWAFWSHSVAVNVETGGAGEGSGGAWLKGGLAVVLGLGGHLLPWRIGWAIWFGLGWTFLRSARGALHVATRRGRWMRPGPELLWPAMGALMLGFWLSVGFTGQHDPSHNLYWKWMLPLVPVLVPLGVAGLWAIAAAAGARWGRPLTGAIVGIGVLQAMFSEINETERQVLRSQAWYRPQVELAQWIEAYIPEDQAMFLDNIPACYIRRRPQERTLISWYDVELGAPGDLSALAAALRAEGVRYVLWFREDWTQAPRVAPALAAGGELRAGGLRLIERSREDGYGWIFYQVVEDGAPDDLPAPLPSMPPAVAAWREFEAAAAADEED